MYLKCNLQFFGSVLVSYSHCFSLIDINDLMSAVRAATSSTFLQGPILTRLFKDFIHLINASELRSVNMSGLRYILQHLSCNDIIAPKVLFGPDALASYRPMSQLPFYL